MHREKVLDILSRICDSDKVKYNPDVKLYEEVLLDSFGTVQLIAALEAELNLSVSLTEIDRDIWATPNKIISFLKGKYQNETL